MLGQERLSVDLPGQQHVSGQSLRHGDGHAEAPFLAFHLDLVGAPEGDLQRRVRVGARRLQHVAQRGARPADVADRAARPGVTLCLGHHLQVGATVARALQPGDEGAGGEAAPQVGDR